MIGVYAGLFKVSCDMCGELTKPRRTVRHTDGASADICDICYGKCLAYPKFVKGVKDGIIAVREYAGA